MANCLICKKQCSSQKNQNQASAAGIIQDFCGEHKLYFEVNFNREEDLKPIIKKHFFTKEQINWISNEANFRKAEKEEIKIIDLQVMDVVRFLLPETIN